MKAQRAFGLSLSWLRVVTVFLIDVAVLVLASHWPGNPRQAGYAWWSGVGIAALLTLIALVTYRRVPLASVLGARLRDRSTDPDALLAEGAGQAIDHRRRYGREAVGIRECRGQLVTVIAVAGRPMVPAGRHHRGTAATFALPVGTVAAAMRQFDVGLDGIDIVSVATRGAGPEARGDDEDTGADGAAGDEQSVPAHRSTWLVLRMDPQHNVAAVATRESLAATLAAATERLAHDLEGRDITARVLTADEFAGVDAAVLAGLRAEQPKQPKQYVTTFWVSPRDITSENLDRLWLSDVDAAVVTVRLTSRRRSTAVSVWVRYHSGNRLHKTLRSEVNRFLGRRLAAVRESLPVPRPVPVLVVPARELDDQEQLVVSLDAAEQQPAVRVGAQP